MKHIRRLGLFFAAAAALHCQARPAGAEREAPDVPKAVEEFLQSPRGQEILGKAMQAFIENHQRQAAQKEAEDAAARLEEQFRNPAKIDIGSSPVKGPADAKITIVEFSDFQCPYCLRGRDTMEELMKAYPGQIRLVFKNLPLPMHPEAVAAARAALAAGKQGKFWEMHDALFASQEKLGEDLYLAKAKEFGLDAGKFKSDMTAPDVNKQIEDDQALASQRGIEGTPAFYVNGVELAGAYPVEHFKTVIDRWLAQGQAK